MRTLRPVVDALAFLCELALLVVLAVAGWGLVQVTSGRLLLAVALPVAAVVVWGIWAAPRSRHRLGDPARFVLQTLLFAAAGALAAQGGHPLLGGVFAVVAVAVFGLTRLAAPAPVE